ncbi:hypothetical protein FE257_002531 [Aspergillus nanangensis]|uniref:Uncharacterized protein n=1 Tax=Aspergillus nanangensis TaxID=2582783 RepID=A0AAD4CSY6_ASPNN|nr:hypothetical protein FE257_002531 [Aspergillus nanangensis]
MLPPTPIPHFLLPRGAPSARALQALTRRRATAAASTKWHRCASTDKPHVLEKPDKFRPPSHPARRVMQTRNGQVINSVPVNYPGPRLSEKEKQEQNKREYPSMFPPEGTVMFKFLTSKWIHIWIAMGVLTTLATFTLKTNFQATSPFAHLLPPWSALLTHPIDTVGQALSVYRMHVQHTSMETREKRQRRVEDAEKRRQYRVAHGLEEEQVGKDGGEEKSVDDQSPVAVEQGEEYVDWDGEKKPVKKWLGIW